MKKKSLLIALLTPIIALAMFHSSNDDYAVALDDRVNAQDMHLALFDFLYSGFRYPRGRGFTFIQNPNDFDFAMPDDIDVAFVGSLDEVMAWLDTYGQGSHNATFDLAISYPLARLFAVLDFHYNDGDTSQHVRGWFQSSELNAERVAYVPIFIGTWSEFEDEFAETGF